MGAKALYYAGRGTKNAVADLFSTEPKPTSKAQLYADGGLQHLHLEPPRIETVGFDMDILWSGVKHAAENTWEIAKNILTAGGYTTLQKRIANYEEMLGKHGSSVLQYKDADAVFKTAVEALGNETSECISLLKDAKDLVERLSYSSCSSRVPYIPSFKAPDLSRVTTTLANFDAAITAGMGTGLGIATSTGAWVLVAYLGTASTGAAISGLGGIAAHNAIMAWFGGGAIAAGGGGMLLGGFVIGAIALVPLVGYSAYKSYSEASRIDAEAAKVVDSSTSNLDNAKKLLDLRKSADNLGEEIAKKRKTFTEDLAQLRIQAKNLAEVAADAANLFAERLLHVAKANGASA